MELGCGSRAGGGRGRRRRQGTGSGPAWCAASLTALLTAGRPRAPSAMAPASRSLLSPPTLLLLLLLLLSLALLGARAEPAAGSAVPAQSRCPRRGRAGGVFVSWAVTSWVGTGGLATGTGTPLGARLGPGWGLVCPTLT